MKTIKSFLLRPTIPVFFVRQRIREDIFKTVRLFLSDRALSRAKAIAVVVDSKGGDMAQTEMLAKKLKMIGAKHHIPIYGFIEGSCVGCKCWISQNPTLCFLLRPQIFMQQKVV